MPKNISGGGYKRQRGGGRKQKGGADEKRSSSLPPGVPTERSQELQKDREAKRKLLKKKVDGLISLIPVSILSELGKDYRNRLLMFALVYILSLNYFVIYKTYSSPRKLGKLNKEENESFWAGVRGFAFGLFICFMLIFRMLMKEKGENVIKIFKNIGEYLFMFSFITGISAASTKYLVSGPLSFLFNII